MKPALNTCVQIAKFILISLVALNVVAHSDGHSEGSKPHTIKNLKQQHKDMWTGGQPSDADLAYLQAQGVKTIINLRPSDELSGFDESQSTKMHNMVYLQLPVGGKSEVTIDSAKSLAKLIDRAEGPVFVHCASGNRVGALFALKARYVDGESAKSALAIGKRYGMTRLESHVVSLLGIDIPKD